MVVLIKIQLPLLQPAGQQPYDLASCSHVLRLLKPAAGTGCLVA